MTRWRVVYKHWEYQSFCFLQLVPDTQVVAPVYPIPPHCPHLAAVPEDGGGAAEAVGLTGHAFLVEDGFTGAAEDGTGGDGALVVVTGAAEDCAGGA